MVLTADKGMALVVMNTEDYKKKAEELLNQKTCRAMASDPTMRLKNKLITLLKSIKAKNNTKGCTPQGLGPQILSAPKHP